MLHITRGLQHHLCALVNSEDRKTFTISVKIHLNISLTLLYCKEHGGWIFNILLKIMFG